MSDVTLSKSVRANLLHLQNTAKMMETTQERLATGKKVNSALDNPSNFFTAESLNARAADIGTLLDSMSNGIRTIEAADNGLTAMTKTIESMQSTLRQARQDKSFEMSSYTLDPDAIDKSAVKTLSLSGGAVGETPVEIALNTADTTPSAPATFEAANAYSDIDLTNDASDTLSFDVTDASGKTTTVTFAQGDADDADGNNIFTIDEAIASANRQLEGDGNAVYLGKNTGKLTFSSAGRGADQTITADNVVINDGAGSGANQSDTDIGLSDPAAGQTDTGADGSDDGVVKSVDDLVTEINNNPDLKGKIRASNDRGQLRIENQSTRDLDIKGIDSSGTIDGEATTPVTIEGNMTRAGLAEQFNSLVSELNTLAEDASFNGVNLLRGDELRIVFNESGSSEIRVTTKGPDGKPQAVNSGTLGIERIDADSLDGDEDIDTLLAGMKSALDAVRGQSSNLGSNLSTVQNREDFTKEMINTLETGASNLTLADTNEEAANMLALQTRQQLSQTALSLASDADQAVLRLFG